MTPEVVIGLEVHAQLLTQSKMFCGCSTAFGAAPNTQTCPVCLGMPGVLPVINRKAVEFAIRTGLALNWTIAPMNRFARKNYFYPDLPKGYQISQQTLPNCEPGGSLPQGGRRPLDVAGGLGREHVGREPALRAEPLAAPGRLEGVRHQGGAEEHQLLQVREGRDGVRDQAADEGPERGREDRA